MKRSNVTGSDRTVSRIGALIMAGILLLPASTASAHPSKIPHRHLNESNADEPSPAKKVSVRVPRSTLSVAFGPSVHYVTSKPGDGSHNWRNMGGGVDLALDRRINPFVGFRLNALVSLHEGSTDSSNRGTTLSAFTGEAMAYLLPEARRIEPYGSVGIGWFGLDGADVSLPMEGFVAQLGIGVRIRMNPAVSIALEGATRMAYGDDSKDRSTDDQVQAVLLYFQSASLRLLVDL